MVRAVKSIISVPYAIISKSLFVRLHVYESSDARVWIYVVSEAGLYGNVTKVALGDRSTRDKVCSRDGERPPWALASVYGTRRNRSGIVDSRPKSISLWFMSQDNHSLSHVIGIFSHSAPSDYQAVAVLVTKLCAKINAIAFHSEPYA